MSIFENLSVIREIEGQNSNANPTFNSLQVKYIHCTYFRLQTLAFQLAPIIMNQLEADWGMDY